MEYLNVLIGNKEMYIPVNDKLGKRAISGHCCGRLYDTGNRSRMFKTI